MSSKNYVKGRNFEYRVQNYLRKKGFYVIRAYGSKGIFDLIAIPPQNSQKDFLDAGYGIQCKTNGYIPPKEREKIKSILDKWSLIPLLAYREKRKLFFKELHFMENWDL